MNTEEIINRLENILIDLDDVLEIIGNILDTPINEMDKLVNGEMPSLAYSHRPREIGLDSRVTQIYDAIEELVDNLK